jgi:hypothetical protein
VLAYRKATPERETQLTWFDREGARRGTLGQPGEYNQIVLSPDGRRVAAEVADAQGQIDLWSFDAARGVASRVTDDARLQSRAVSPAPSPLDTSTSAAHYPPQSIHTQTLADRRPRAGRAFLLLRPGLSPVNPLDALREVGRP